MEELTLKELQLVLKKAAKPEEEEEQEEEQQQQQQQQRAQEEEQQEQPEDQEQEQEEEEQEQQDREQGEQQDEKPPQQRQAPPTRNRWKEGGIGGRRNGGSSGRTSVNKATVVLKPGQRLEYLFTGGFCCGSVVRASRWAGWWDIAFDDGKEMCVLIETAQEGGPSTNASRHCVGDWILVQISPRVRACVRACACTAAVMCTWYTSHHITAAVL